MQLEALTELNQGELNTLPTDETKLVKVRSCQLFNAYLKGLRKNEIINSPCTYPECMGTWQSCTQKDCDNNPGYKTTQQEIVASDCIYPHCLNDPKECSLRGCN